MPRIWTVMEYPQSSCHDFGYTRPSSLVCGVCCDRGQNILTIVFVAWPLDRTTNGALTVWPQTLTTLCNMHVQNVFTWLVDFYDLLPAARVLGSSDLLLNTSFLIVYRSWCNHLELHLDRVTEFENCLDCLTLTFWWQLNWNSIMRVWPHVKIYFVLATRWDREKVGTDCTISLYFCTNGHRNHSSPLVGAPLLAL